jgi:hypothetical protein
MVWYPARNEKTGGKSMTENTTTAQQARLETRFRNLAAAWKDEAAVLSSVSDTIALPLYQEIIRMGPPAVPLLLRELERDPHYWFWALTAITGEDPVPPSSRGNVAEMIQAWLRWGKDKGYSW